MGTRSQHGRRRDDHQDPPGPPTIPARGSTPLPAVRDPYSVSGPISGSVASAGTTGTT
ncbi:MAG: hypothetical protein AVDCRST_MAG54-317 [uncultured Actinomycetospora sp.]|uniref:Uncharacterized protein n=1 Tax=uncultured Actinomycetospora sp. TaxID=1135996 RepID=A0A6J4H7Z5_9PSEU|nr:MAG: hypothetical protein AVDCRST_MAG54-317 [uncultured Actinomycetospora sp.]